MNSSELEQRLREVIRQQPVPQPTEKLMQVILRRRQAGESVLFPDEHHVSRRSILVRWLVVPALAAAVLILLVPVSNRVRRPSAVSNTADAGMFGVDILMAQATDHPAYPVIHSSRVLPARSWRYAWKEVNLADVDLTGTWRGERVAQVHQSIPAYRYAYSGWGRLRDSVLSDTAWLDDKLFLPLTRHAVTATGERIVQEFKQSSVLTGWTTPSGYTRWSSEDYNTGSFRMAGDPKPRPVPRFAGLARQVGTWRLQMITALEAADLSPEWKGSLEMISAPGGFWASRFWIDFQVIGEERVTVPSGTFDTWVVQVGDGDLFQLWVGKENHLIVQIGAPRGTVREVLVTTQAGKE